MSTLRLGRSHFHTAGDRDWCRGTRKLIRGRSGLWVPDMVNFFQRFIHPLPLITPIHQDGSQHHEELRGQSAPMVASALIIPDDYPWVGKCIAHLQAWFLHVLDEMRKWLKHGTWRDAQEDRHVSKSACDYWIKSKLLSFVHQQALCNLSSCSTVSSTTYALHTTLRNK
jgi:hypothetical protein